MKTSIKESLKNLIADRYLLVLVAGLIVLAVTLSVVVGLSIHPSVVQLVSHYSAFGVTHTYTDQWVYLLVFVVFELVVAALHSVIAVKLLVTKGRSLAIVYAWSGIGIVLLGWITAMAVLNAWDPRIGL